MKTMIKFSPLLFLYIVIVLVFSNNVSQHDEVRYVMFANNLSHGFYSDPNDINLWNGPGYPIILMPFVLLRLPWLVAKMLNALFLFGAVLYFYYTLRLYMRERQALFFSYLLGAYPPMIRHVHLLITESLAFFLISGFLFYFCRLFKNDRHRWFSLFVASLYLGYLALTKTAFGFVITFGLLSFFILFLFKKRDALKKTILVYLIALIFCLPYLYYTYSLTGKIFYWGNAGAMSLYWMSSPYKNELGDWHEDYTLEEKSPELARNHLGFFKRLWQLKRPQRDDEFIKQATYNIRHYPLKYFKNWLANIGRLLFSYPFSYTPQKFTTFFYMIPNMFIVVFSFLLIYPSYCCRRFIPYEIYALLLFALIAFGGSTLFSAYSRFFSILVPIFALWIFFTITNILKIEIRC